jgi:hypothetical protein
MVFAAVGIKCPECAGQPAGVKKAKTRARTSAGLATGALVTKGLIGISVLVYLLQIAQAGNINGRAGEIWFRGSLIGGFVADGEWWRLITSAFIHASPIHLLFNMIMLWWFGSALEELLGRVRYLGVVLVSILGGAAGALLVTQANEITDLDRRPPRRAGGRRRRDSRPLPLRPRARRLRAPWSRGRRRARCRCRPEHCGRVFPRPRLCIAKG